MPTDNAAAWDRLSADYQAGARLPTDVAHYGPDIATEAELRLLGDLRGKRVVELGCGGAQCSIAFAKAGAVAIGIDFSAEQLAFARRLVDREQVRVELRQGDLADLAFLQAESVDLVFSAYAFGFVRDLRRVFRQVHRVLRTGAPLVFSLPHPAYDMIDDDADDPLTIR
ncbi:MAG: class I SAM-dependent methyltransferase, partial [Acidimicrobiales bacterium]